MIKEKQREKFKKETKSNKKLIYNLASNLNRRLKNINLQIFLYSLITEEKIKKYCDYLKIIFLREIITSRHLLPMSR